ncbi:unnamed protein product [Musa textilis]
MPRGSRHRSHRSHKHSRDRSDSEEAESPRERRIREEESTAISGARVSRDLEPEKRRLSNENAGKEVMSSINGDTSGEKKRKAREDQVVVVADRWNGGQEDDHKRWKGEEFGHAFDNSSRSKAPDSKASSSRRHEVSDGRGEDRGGKNDSVKEKSEMTSSRRENSYYKDGSERGSNKEGETHDSRLDKSDDLCSRKHGTRVGAGTEEIATKNYTKINDRQAQDVVHSAETEKGLEKHMRRRESREDSEDKDKLLDDSRDFDDRRLSYRDDYTLKRSYKDEKHEDAKYRGKYKIDNEKDKKHHDDKYQDEWSSKDHTSGKSDKCHFRDDIKSLETHYKKNKLHNTDHDGTSYVDDLDTKLKDSRGKKRYSDERDDRGDVKIRGAKERHELVEKNVSSTGRTGSRNDKSRSEYQHADKADSSPKNNRLKGSTSSGTFSGKDYNRDISKVAESAHRESAPEGRLRAITNCKGDSLTSSGLRDKVSGTRSGKLTTKDDIHSGEVFVEIAASKYDRATRSPNQSKGRSSANSGRRFSERSPSKYDRTARQRLDIEIGQRTSSSKNGEKGESASEKLNLDDVSQTNVCVRESTNGPSSINQSGYSDYSPNHLRPLPPARLGIDSPSVLGSYQDDNKVQSSDHKSYNRYKRIGDLGYGKGHANVWKGAPNWPSPVTNGFIPLQRGPPPAGFHPAISQFSASPLFGVRPSMDLTHGGVSYHMHEMAERFPGHGRPFLWHNPVDQLCHPHMQMWDRNRNNGMFNNEYHIYGSQESDENSQLIDCRGWETGFDMWKGQNGNNMDIHVFKKERESSIHSLTDELTQLKHLPFQSTEPKLSTDLLPAKSDVELPRKAVTKKTFEPSNMPSDKITNHGANYLSRIDISPNLVGLELYKRCTSLLGTLNISDTCSLGTQRCFQTNKDGSIVKMRSTSSVLNSFLPTTKDTVFKRAMSLYEKRKGRVNGKHAVPAPIYSEEKKEASPETSGNGKVQQGGADRATTERAPLCDFDSANNMKAGGNTVVQETDCPGIAVNHDSDFISCGDHHGSEASEASVGECKGSVSGIPSNSVENTH